MSATLALLGGAPAFDPPLPLVRPTMPETAPLLKRLGAILDSGQLTNGRTVRELEELVATRLGVPHVVGVASCTSGLMLVYQALGCAGRVVLPSFTFAASAHAVVWAGGQPAFADVVPDRLTLDPEEAAALAEGAVALSATHVYGTPADVDRLAAVAARHGLPIVYDAAHALGSRCAGRPVGGFGAAEVFSLSPTKVTVAGEGGLVATHDEALAEALVIGRDYGNPGDYDCRFPGLNARLSELHAAVAVASLAGLDQRIAVRNELARAFQDAVEGLPGVRFPQPGAGDLSTYKDLTLLVDEATYGLSAAQLGRVLSADGVDTRRYYAPPIHQQKAYAQTVLERPLPVTDRVAQQVLTVPLWSHMSTAQVLGIADLVTRCHAHAPQLRGVLS
jgi:dTDP-4-amino-4,6-dideoxygalactose transaminase